MKGNLNPYYLEQMEVDTWLLRSNNKTEPGYHYQVSSDLPLCSEGHAEVKLLLVANGFDVVEEGNKSTFPSKSRKLFHKMLSSINLSEEDVCMMPSINRGHLMNSKIIGEERALVRDAVTQQMTLVGPKVILVLGHDLGQCFLDENLSLSDMRTQRHCFDNIPVIVSYHPDDLLENPFDKKKAYHDWLSLKQLLMDE